ncbi:Predicted amidohydrolase [Parasphingorhabdus marina DSM 22363]|uniref:Predicted amidohydrolase n=1 Tax=Parasphingorhabdus marina DSM 22363 TaxID=1123272 RepID=A0A1N6GKM7_9SPHN|nr:carbon-nitrogen hydrolase family protein [Parasphingorhabdus marina]SIO08108.1 Predicted amidohydrolase [Parasphingorhabdus marina DSM 22363]
MRVALAQTCTGLDPEQNANTLCSGISEAAAGGAEILFTPEMSGLIDRNRSRAASKIRTESGDMVLSAVQKQAAHCGIWVALGSLALRNEQRDDDKWVNRSLLIDPDGLIVARYDKIHLFDVDLDAEDSWRESAAYASGDKAVLARAGGASIGLSICYDVRFSRLYAALAKHGADILTVPAAFTVPTGKAHWEVLLRARAIESAAFVVAAAQCGTHEDSRRTYGHSLVVDPWGRVLLDMGEEIGVGFCDINLKDIEEVRQKLPVLKNRRDFADPELLK